MNSQIKYGAVISYVGIFINIVIGLVYTPWMIRCIGQADYGLYTLAMSVIGIFVFDFGLGQAVTRFAAKYIAEGQQDKVDQLMGVTYKLYLIADALMILLLVGVYFFIPQIYQGLTPEEIEKFKIVYAIAATFSVLSFPFIPLNGIVSAYELFIQLKNCDLLHKIIIVVLMTGCLLMGFGLYALVIVNAIAGMLMIIIKLIVLRRRTPLRIDWHFWSRGLLREIISFSVWITVAALAQRLVLNICPSILGYASDSRSIAVFGIAMTLEGYVYTFTSAIKGLFLPKVTRLVTDGQHEDILPLMVRVGRIQLFILGLIILGFLCTGQNFINAWLGEDFSKVFLCSVLMMAPSFVGQTQNIASTTIVVQNKVKKSARISVIKAVVNLLLAYPLTVLWGVYGMALSIFISYMVSLLQYNILYHKDLKIDIPLFFKDCFGKMAVPLVLTTFICYPINYLIDNNEWIHFVAKVLIFCIVYFVSMFTIGLNQEEKTLMLSPLKMVLKK